MKKYSLEGLTGEALESAKNINAMIDAIEATKSNVDVTALKAEIAELKKGLAPDLTSKMVDLEKALELQGAELAKKQFSNEVSTKSIKDLLVASKVLENLKNRVQSEFELKAVGDQAVSNVVVATTQPRMSVLGDQGEVYAVNRNSFTSILDYVDVKSTDKATIVWVDEVNGEGSIGTTAEGVAKNQIDLDYQEVTSNAVKYTGLVKVTEESLDDISYMEGEINRVLNEKLQIAKAAAVLTDVNSAATTFSLTDFDGTVNDADIIDAIVAATAQSVLSGFQPLHIVMHPVDIAKFQLVKSTNIPRIQTTANGMTVNGLTIIQTFTPQTKGTFVLGDLSKFRVRIYKEKLVMGWDADDFSKNKRTIIGETRMIKYISTNEKTSLVKGTFATIISALETP